MSRGLVDRCFQPAPSPLLRCSSHWTLSRTQAWGSSMYNEETKNKNSCVSVRHSFAFNQRFPWLLPGGRNASGWFFGTEQTAHTNKGILWGFSAPVHWSRWQWVLGLPCCRSFSGAALPAPARSTRHSPAKKATEAESAYRAKQEHAGLKIMSLRLKSAEIDVYVAAAVYRCVGSD